MASIMWLPVGVSGDVHTSGARVEELSVSWTAAAQVCSSERLLTSVCLPCLLRLRLLSSPLDGPMLSLSVGVLSALQVAPLNICRLPVGKKTKPQG